MTHCTTCGSPLCGESYVISGEFVLRSGEISNAYTVRCIRHAGHDGEHEMR